MEENKSITIVEDISIGDEVEQALYIKCDQELKILLILRILRT